MPMRHKKKVFCSFWLSLSFLFRGSCGVSDQMERAPNVGCSDVVEASSADEEFIHPRQNKIDTSLHCKGR